LRTGFRLQWWENCPSCGRFEEEAIESESEAFHLQRQRRFASDYRDDGRPRSTAVHARQQDRNDRDQGCLPGAHATAAIIHGAGPPEGGPHEE